MALLAMAIANLGLRGPLLHRLAGGRHHRLDPRQGQDHRHHAGPDPGRADDGAIPIVAGFQGVSQTTKDITTLGRGRLRHHRGRPGGCARAPTTARSTPTWTASSPPTRGWCRPPGGSRASPTRRCWRWRRAAPRCCMLRCVEYARRYKMPIHVRSSFSNREGTWVTDAMPPGTELRVRKARPWSRRSSPGWRRTAVRRRSRSSASPTRSARRRGSSAPSPTPAINIDMIVQNVSAAATGRTDISFTLPRDDGHAGMAALRADAGRGRLRLAASTTTGSARSRSSARACARTRASARRSSARSPRRA